MCGVIFVICFVLLLYYVLAAILIPILLPLLGIIVGGFLSYLIVKWANKDEENAEKI